MYNVCTYSCVHKPPQRYNQPHTVIVSMLWQSHGDCLNLFISIVNQKTFMDRALSRIIAHYHALSCMLLAYLLVLRTLRCILHRLSYIIQKFTPNKITVIFFWDALYYIAFIGYFTIAGILYIGYNLYLSVFLYFYVFYKWFYYVFPTHNLITINKDTILSWQWDFRLRLVFGAVFGASISAEFSRRFFNLRKQADYPLSLHLIINIYMQLWCKYFGATHYLFHIIDLYNIFDIFMFLKTCMCTWIT